MCRGLAEGARDDAGAGGYARRARALPANPAITVYTPGGAVRKPRPDMHNSSNHANGTEMRTTIDIDGAVEASGLETV